MTLDNNLINNEHQNKNNESPANRDGAYSLFTVIVLSILATEIICTTVENIGPVGVAAERSDAIQCSVNAGFLCTAST